MNEEVALIVKVQFFVLLHAASVACVRLLAASAADDAAVGHANMRPLATCVQLLLRSCAKQRALRTASRPELGYHYFHWSAHFSSFFVSICLQTARISKLSVQIV